MNTPLHLPRTFFGFGAITSLNAALSALGIKKPLLVTDKGLLDAGVVSKVRSVIDRHTPISIYADVTENPVFADADRGAECYAQEQCDGVIALGGGSVIDAAKYISLLGTHPGSVANYAGVATAQIGVTAPLIAIPTTAGTGSEANSTAGIHPTADAIAVGVDSPSVLPRTVILDPELTLSLPPRLTAATGIDALSHCIEGYLSKYHNPFADSLALDGISRAARSLKRAVTHGDDLEARSEMMIAAYAGGAAISMGLGPAHAIAISCGDQGFHHGVLSGIGIVAVIDHMASHQPLRAAKLRAALELTPDFSLGTGFKQLMGELGLPTSLRELGYSATSVSMLSAAAHSSFFNLSAWHHPSASEYADMIGNSLL